MKRYFFGILAWLFIPNGIHAQGKVPLALKILPGLEHLNGHWFFSIEKPEGVNVSKGQMILCKGIYKGSDADTITKGEGRISYVETNYIQCEMSDTSTGIDPGNGDLCFLVIDKDVSRKDVFYKIARYNINWLSVTNDTLFNAMKSLNGWTEDQDNVLLGNLKADIQYTGSAMLKQNDSQQQMINDGDFKGQNLFNAMTGIKDADVMNFLKYVWARPYKYSGSSWHFSEVFATWMTSGTPKFTGDISN